MEVLKKTIILGIVVLITLCIQTIALPSNRESKIEDRKLPEMKTETKTEVKIKQEWKGSYCGYTESSSLVIKDKDQWREIWAKVYALQLPKPDLPEINFEKDMIIAVFMGEHGSGGFSIEIKDIFKTDKEIVVEVEERKPDHGSIVTMALTQPYHIVVISISPLPIDIRR